MRLFEGDDCAGDAITLDLSDVKDNTCTFHGGKSVKLECGHAALNHGMSWFHDPAVSCVC